MQKVSEQAAKAGFAGGSARPWHALLLVGLCLVVYLPGFFTIPPVDRDESRFAQASRQMFESAALPAAQRDPKLHGGGLLVPMVQDRPRLNKPPLIYWLQAGSAAVFTGGNPLRDAIWMYRVPSLVAAIVAVLLTWRIGAGMLGGRVGVLAGAMLAVCPMVAWEAHQARADMLLVAWTVGAMGAMWEIWRRGGTEARRHEGKKSLTCAVLFWACIAGGVMTKGPITPMVAGLAALGLSLATRRWGWLLRLRPALGLAIVVLAVGPWVVAVAERVGWHGYAGRIYDETIGRSISAREGHWGPPGYHLVLLVALFWPGSLLTGWGVVQAWKVAMGGGAPIRGSEETSPASASSVTLGPSRFRGAIGDPLLFCLAWAIPSWIVFELAGTKLPHYVMPLYPALAIVSAWAIVTCGGTRAGIRAGVVLWMIVGLGLAALPAILVESGLGAGQGARLLADLATGVLTILVVGSAVSAWRGAFGRAIRFGVAHIVILSVVLFGVVLPRAKEFWPSRDVAALLGPTAADGSRPIAAAGYHEDSVVFWTRGRVQKIETAEAPRWVAEHPDGVLIRALEPNEQGGAMRIVEGWDYSTGKRVRLGVSGPGGAP